MLIFLATHHACKDSLERIFNIEQILDITEAGAPIADAINLLFYITIKPVTIH